MKRTTALLLTLVLLLTTAACSSGPSAPGSSSGGESASSKTEESSAVQGGEPSGETVTLKILCKNDYSSEIKTADWEQYDVSKTFMGILEELGIQLELECIANDNFPNVLNTRMAAGVDMPDIVAVAFDPGITGSDVVDWGKNGLIIPASQLMEEYDEDGSIAAFWDKYAPGTRGAQTAPDGNLYWFAYLYNSGAFDSDTREPLPSVSFRLPSIREDWVEAAGEKIKLAYTPDELYELLVKIQEADPNGTGAKDEIVNVKIDTFYDNFARGFGLNTSTLAYIDSDGKVQSNFYDDRLIQYLEFMKKLYDNGMYDTAAFSGDSFSSELITSNKAAVTYNYATWGDYEKQMAVEGAQYTPFVLSPDGDLQKAWYAQGDTPGITFNQYFVTSACEHPEAAAKLFDFVYTEDYAKLCAEVEGVTFEMDEKGVLSYIDLGTPPTEEGELWDWRHKTMGLSAASLGLYALPQMATIPVYTQQVNPNSDGYIQKKQAAVKEFNASFDTCDFQANHNLALATDEESDRLSEISEPLNTYAAEMISDIILGQRDISTLQEGIAELESLGLKDYMQIVQDRYDRAQGAAD
jgi:putative aldouronate transport system substrate-binding protein